METNSYNRFIGPGIRRKSVEGQQVDCPDPVFKRRCGLCGQSDLNCDCGVKSHVKATAKVQE